MTLRFRSFAGLLVMVCTTITGCHRYETVNELESMTEYRGKLTLSAEGRANNARRLGGVPMEITGVIFSVGGDSIGIRADQIIFADLGSVAFAQGELRFITRDVASASREVLARKRSLLASGLALLGVAAIGIAFSLGDGVFGPARGGPPTPR